MDCEEGICSNEVPGVQGEGTGKIRYQSFISDLDCESGLSRA